MKRAREQKPLPPSPAVQHEDSDNSSFLLGYATGIPLGQKGLLGAVAGGHFGGVDTSEQSTSSDFSSSDTSFSSSSSDTGGSDGW